MRKLVLVAATLTQLLLTSCGSDPSRVLNSKPQGPPSKILVEGRLPESFAKTSTSFGGSTLIQLTMTTHATPSPAIDLNFLRVDSAKTRSIEGAYCGECEVTLQDFEWNQKDQLITVHLWGWEETGTNSPCSLFGQSVQQSGVTLIFRNIPDYYGQVVEELRISLRP